MTQTSHRQIFVGLDGLRGTSAAIVVIFHLQSGRSLDDLTFPAGYLAVDMFFMLSGFVIAHAYEERLKSDLTFARFAGLRAIRLYPLYILGCALLLGHAVLQAAYAGELWRAREFVYALPYAVALVPNFPAGPAGWFKLNPPAWSLFYEWVYNLLYAAFLLFLTTRVIVSVVVS